MKKLKDHNIDLIGSQSSLTKEQEKLISDYLKSRSVKKQVTSSKTKTKRKVAA